LLLPCVTQPVNLMESVKFVVDKCEICCRYHGFLYTSSYVQSFMFNFIPCQE
jgi:hypothetical protein